MSRILLLYATVEGQTLRIAQRMAQTLRNAGHAVETLPVDAATRAVELGPYDGVIVGASIHYGRHPRCLRSLVRGHRESLDARANAFFSVSLSAGGPGAKPAAAKRYLDVFLHQVRWRPQQTATFAGAVQYSKYGPFKRWLMVLFVGLAGGDTDTSRDYEYTDWPRVNDFAQTFAKRLGSP